VKAVRGFSDFGYSYVYVVFEDGTEPSWARSRTLESLSSVLPRLPQGVKPELGRGAVRLSVGRFTTEDEIDRAVSLNPNQAEFFELRDKIDNLPPK